MSSHITTGQRCTSLVNNFASGANMPNTIDQFRFRKFLTTTSASLIAVAACSAPAFAQQQSGQEGSGEQPDTATPEGQILVTGTRLQNQRAIEAKRDANVIIDSISQDEIGRQPDFNIADAIRRAPGVSTVRDEEEGLFIAVRGLNPDFTFVTLDGGLLASLDFVSARRVSLEVIPSTVISRADVYKTRDATIDGNTIGGQVDLVTRSAYDSNGLFANLSGAIGYFDADAFDREGNGAAVRFDGTIATTFGDADQFGFVLAGSYFSREQDEERALNFYNGDYSAPTFSIWNGIENPLERFGGFAKLEFKPSDRVYMQINGLYFEQNENFDRASLVLFNNSALNPTGPGRGEFAEGGGAQEHLNSDDGKSQYGINYSAMFKIAEASQIDLRATYSNGSARGGRGDSLDTAFRYVGPVDGLGYSFEFEGDGIPPQHTFLKPDDAENLDNYALNRARRSSIFNDSDALDLEASFNHEFGTSGWDLTTGVRFRDLSRQFDFVRNSLTYLGATPLLLSQFGRLSPSYRAPYAPINSPIIDNAAVLAFIGANPSLFSGNLDTTQNRTPDFDISESVLAGYAALGYAGDRVRINAGLRVEQTDVEASAFETVNGVRQPITQTSDYTNWLPSVGITYDITDQLKLRAAYSRALGRANLPDLNPSRTVIEVSGVTTIAGGNTQLDPRVSDNFDVSLEYYFDGGRSLASVALFHKSIADEIFRLAVDTTVNGAPVVTTQPLNAQSASVTGFEINLVKDRLDFLPGLLADFGVSANYTYIWADARVPTTSGAIRELDFLIEQPDSLINASLFYQSGPVEARVSYNRTGRFARSIDPANPDNDNFIAAFETIDAQARWRIADNFTVIVEGRNLTDETNIELTGPGASKTEDFSRFGRAYFLGLTYNY